MTAAASMIQRLPGILAIVRTIDPPGGPASTFDSAAKGAQVTLSALDLAMTVANGNSQSVKSTTSKSTGKFYYEWTMTILNTGGFLGMGIVDSAFAPGSSGIGFFDPANHSIGALFTTSGNVIDIGASNVATFQSGTAALGDVCAIAVDIDNTKFWAMNVTQGSFWNNSGSADPSGGIGGVSFAALTGPDYFAAAGWQNSDTAGKITWNPGDTFVGIPPSGFIAWH